MRFLFGSIADWDGLFREAYRTCKPGGWVESFEPSVITRSDHREVPSDSYLARFSQFFVDGGKKVGRTFLVVDDEIQRKAMEAAGFVDIKEHNWKVSRRD